MKMQDLNVNVQVVLDVSIVVVQLVCLFNESFLMVLCLSLLRIILVTLLGLHYLITFINLVMIERKSDWLRGEQLIVNYALKKVRKLKSQTRVYIPVFNIFQFQ